MRVPHLLASLLLVTPCSAACSSGSSSTTETGVSLSGTVAGRSIGTVSAVARYESVGRSTVNGQTTYTRGLRILFSDKANDCSALHFASAATVDVRVPGDDVSAGSYEVVNASQQTPKDGQAEADFDAVDGACNDVVAETASGGTVTISTVTIDVVGPGQSSVAGKVDLAFPDGHLAGNFTALLCPDADAGTAASGDGGPALVCQ